MACECYREVKDEYEYLYNDLALLSERGSADSYPRRLQPNNYQGRQLSRSLIFKENEMNLSD